MGLTLFSPTSRICFVLLLPFVPLRAQSVEAWCSQVIVSRPLRSVYKIAAGGSHSLALGANGTVFAWGNNLMRPGDPISTHGLASVPEGLTGVVAIAAGEVHNLALKADGTVIAWGAAPSVGQATVPSGQNAVIAIAAGT